MDADEHEAEPENECEACGEDHPIAECGNGYCARCREILDNCDCEEPIEVDAAEFVALEHKQ